MPRLPQHELFDPDAAAGSRLPTAVPYDPGPAAYRLWRSSALGDRSAAALPSPQTPQSQVSTYRPTISTLPMDNQRFLVLPGIIERAVCRGRMLLVPQFVKNAVGANLLAVCPPSSKTFSV